MKWWVMREVVGKDEGQRLTPKHLQTQQLGRNLEKMLPDGPAQNLLKGPLVEDRRAAKLKMDERVLGSKAVKQKHLSALKVTLPIPRARYHTVTHPSPEPFPLSSPENDTLLPSRDFPEVLHIPGRPPKRFTVVVSTFLCECRTTSDTSSTSMFPL